MVQGMTNQWSPLGIYPLGPETQDTNTGKAEKTGRKANPARHEALPRGDCTSVLNANSAVAGDSSGEVFPILRTVFPVPWS